jgi:hypothetical protein
MFDGRRRRLEPSPIAGDARENVGGRPGRVSIASWLAAAGLLLPPIGGPAPDGQHEAPRGGIDVTAPTIDARIAALVATQGAVAIAGRLGEIDEGRARDVMCHGRGGSPSLVDLDHGPPAGAERDSGGSGGDNDSNVGNDGASMLTVRPSSAGASESVEQEQAQTWQKMELEAKVRELER